MNAKIVAACQAFSLGQSAKALRPHRRRRRSGTSWGTTASAGKAGVEATCAEAEAEGNPNFKNLRTIEGRIHVVVEGNDLEGDVHYCDIYTIEENLIYEISSYCLARFDEEEGEE